MEILSEHTEWVPFILAVIVVVLIAVVMTVMFCGIIIVGISDGFEGGDVLGIIVTGTSAGLLIALLVTGIQQGPDVYYESIVTDYNEVYDAGYTVVSTEGKIVTLTKEDE